MRRVYIKRNGGMIFWRLFAIGGSFYIATQSDAAKQERKEARARNRMMLRNRAKRFGNFILNEVRNRT